MFSSNFLTVMEKTRDQAIGENVRRLRAARSQQSIADEMREMGHEKWSQATVWAVEKGSRPLRLVEATDLAFVLEVPMERMLSTPEESEIERLGKNVIRGASMLREAVDEMLNEQDQLRHHLRRTDINWDRVEEGLAAWAQGLANWSPITAVTKHVKRWEDEHGEHREEA